LIAEVEAETKAYDSKKSAALSRFQGIKNMSGKEVFTAADLIEGFDRSTSREKLINIPLPGALYGGPTMNRIGEDTNEVLSPKQKKLKEIFDKKRFGVALSDSDKAIYNRAKELKNYFGSTIKQINKEKLQRQGEILGERLSKYQEVRGTINPGNKEDIARTKAVISGLMGKIAQHGGADSYKKEEYNPETLSAMLKSSDVGFTFVKANDGSAVLEVAGGGAVQKLHLTANEFMRAFPKYAAITPITEIKSIIHQSKNKTTNITGKSNPVGAQYTGWDLPLIKDQAWASRVRVDIEGSLSGADGQYQVRLFYNDPNDGWISGILNTAGFVGEDGLQIIINNIGESAINDLRNKNNQK
jgi:hypothetical protein